MFKEFIFPGYVRISRIEKKSARRTSDRGRLIHLGLLIAMVVGLDTDRTLAYQLFAFLLCMVVVSRLSLRLQPPQVSVRRRLPRYATANEPFEYYITVTNEGDEIEKDLTLIDNPRMISPDLDQYRDAREPGEETRNAWDRWIGYHRFMWLQRHNTGISIEQTGVPDLSLRAGVDVKVEAVPLRRGIVHLESTMILHPDPLALYYGVTQFSNPQQLLVLPRRYRISRQFEMPGGRHFQPGGINPTWSIGESDEFVSLRDYRDGDSLRKIHWASTAKRDKPVVKEFQDEYFVRQALVLDTAIADPILLEEAIAVAASFVLQSNTADSLLDLIYTTNKVEVITSGRGYAHANQQLEALATAGRTTMDPDLLSQAVFKHAELISGCILILGAWDERRRQLLDKLRAMNIPTEAFIVSDQDIGGDVGSRAHVLPVGEIQDRLLSL